LFCDELTAAIAEAYQTVALTGQIAPDVPGDPTYSSFHSPVLNDQGAVAFRASLTGNGVTADNQQAIWSGDAGSLRLVAREGAAAPGATTGQTFNSFSSSVVLNDVGQTAFLAELRGNGVSDSNESGIWSEGSGSLELVARQGDPAVGAPSSVKYDEFRQPLLNNAGQVAFVAELLSSVSYSHDRGLWSEGSGSLALVARVGSRAPDTPPGVRYSFFDWAWFNNAGQTAFDATLTGSGSVTNNRGIWSEGSGSLGLVARSGNLAPGTIPGVDYRAFLPPAMNDAGDTAFVAELTGIDVNDENKFGIWKETEDGLSLRARGGDAAPGTDIGVSFAEFDLLALNSAGRIAFRSTLAGSGVSSVNDQGVWMQRSGDWALVARAGDAAPGTPGGVTFDQISQLSFNDAGQVAFRATVTGNGVTSTNDSGIWATDRNGAVHLLVREGDELEVAPGDFRAITYVTSFLSYSNGDVGNRNGRPNGFNNFGQFAFNAGFSNGNGIFISNAVAVPEPNAMAIGLLLIVGACRMGMHQRRVCRR
jgi:hypothetical protein